MKFIVILLSLFETALSVYFIRLFFLRLNRGLSVHLPLIAAMLFYFAGGALTAYLTLPDVTLNAMLIGRGIEHEHVIAALLLTLLFAGLIHYFAEALPAYTLIPKRLVTDMLDRLAVPTLPFTAVCGVILGISGYVVASGRLVFHGTENIDDVVNEGDPLLQLMTQMIYLLPLLCGYRMFGKGKLWLTIPVLLASLALALSLGRQKLVIMLFFLLLGYALNTAVKVRPTVKVALLASLVGVCFLGFLVSISVRMASYYLPKTATGQELAAYAFQMILKGQQDRKTDVAANTQENVDARAFNPEIFLAQLTSARRDREGALGEVFVNACEKTVPGAFWPEKQNYIEKEEDIASRSLHLSVGRDEGKSLLNGGYIELREPGLLVYAWLAVGVIGITIWMIKAMRLPFFVLMGICSLLLTVLGSENSVVTWILVLRSALLYLLIDRFLSHFGWRDNRSELYAYAKRMRDTYPGQAALASEGLRKHES